MANSLVEIQFWDKSRKVLLTRNIDMAFFAELSSVITTEEAIKVCDLLQAQKQNKNAFPNVLLFLDCNGKLIPIQQFLERNKNMTNGQNIEAATDELSTVLDPYQWFYSAEVENQRCITVYVDYMNTDVFSKVPDFFKGFQVKLAFKGYLLCEETYGKKQTFDIT